MASETVSLGTNMFGRVVHDIHQNEVLKADILEDSHMSEVNRMPEPHRLEPPQKKRRPDGRLSVRRGRK